MLQRITIPAVTLALLLLPMLAQSLPRFAARVGAPCSLCHVDPAGGGMRTDYARHVWEVAELPIAGLERPEKAPVMDAKVTDSVALGADLRMMFQDLRQDAGPPEKPPMPTMSHFFLMESALYLSANLWERVTLYLAPSFYGADNLMYEAMAIVHLPWQGSYIKIGRFLPAFGLRTANHTVFTRKQSGWGAKTKEVGCEAGFELGPVLLQASVFNGVESDLDYDDNTGKGLATRLSYRLRTRSFKGNLGLSGYYNVRGTEAEGDMPDSRIEDLRYGAFAGLSVGRISWIGEAVMRRSDDRSKTAAEGITTTFASMQELSVLAIDGLDIIGSYELWDDDTTAAGNAIHRYGVGFDAYPWPFTEFGFRYRRTRGDTRHVMSGLSEYILVSHVFF